jgi:hypothetical protein
VIPKKTIDITRDGDDRVIVKWEGIVLDIITSMPTDPGLIVEAYPAEGSLGGQRIERIDWTHGRWGDLRPGQVATYRIEKD